ncbi:hypothetical protein VNO80_07742 [Phaseolus coccineus]|uniref:Uncharacterized protein n=1 Tax=Phaseolus coccineus TaxID=3886 RepID=A0AAN9RJW3_PHACN
MKNWGYRRRTEEVPDSVMSFDSVFELGRTSCCNTLYQGATSNSDLLHLNSQNFLQLCKLGKEFAALLYLLRSVKIEFFLRSEN